MKFVTSIQPLCTITKSCLIKLNKTSIKSQLHKFANFCTLFVSMVTFHLPVCLSVQMGIKLNDSHCDCYCCLIVLKKKKNFSQAQRRSYQKSETRLCVALVRLALKNIATHTPEVTHTHTTKLSLAPSGPWTNPARFKRGETYHPLDISRLHWAPR